MGRLAQRQCAGGCHGAEGVLPGLGEPVGAVGSPEAATARAATSVHAPNKWRVNGPLMNVAAFGEANTCKAGSAMVAKDPVRVWP